MQIYTYGAHKTAYCCLVLQPTFFEKTPSSEKPPPTSSEALVLGSLSAKTLLSDLQGNIPTMGRAGLDIFLHDCRSIPVMLPFSHPRPGQGACLTSIHAADNTIKTYSYELNPWHINHPADLPKDGYRPLVSLEQDDIAIILKTILKQDPDASHRSASKSEIVSAIALSSPTVHPATVSAKAEELVMVLFSARALEAHLTVYFPGDASKPLVFYLQPTPEQVQTWAIHFIVSQTTRTIHDVLPAYSPSLRPPPIPSSRPGSFKRVLHTHDGQGENDNRHVRSDTVSSNQQSSTSAAKRTSEDNIQSDAKSRRYTLASTPSHQTPPIATSFEAALALITPSHRTSPTAVAVNSALARIDAALAACSPN
ncbi:hypothetical protein CALCODRAFT_541485, partial [Calocera cornea HHB12733]